MKLDRLVAAALAVAGASFVATTALADRLERSPVSVDATASTSSATATFDDSSFGCFRGDTTVETEAGRQPIRDVRVGDRVWSWDDAQEKRILSRVTQIYAYPARQLRTLVAGGETFRVTDRHPFWVDGKGWIEAARLVSGDQLRTGGKDLVAVRSNERADAIAFYQGYDASMDRSAALRHPIYQLQRVSTGAAPSESGIVYNIEVDGVHNYYVGDKGILVHNK